MRNVKYILILLSMITVFGCKITTSNEEISFEEIDQFILNVDSNTNYAFYDQQLLEKDTTILISTLDFVKQEINVFNLKKPNYKKRIKICNEGPNGVLKTDGFLFINFDSIFLFHRFPSVIYLIDSASQVKTVWKFNPQFKNSEGTQRLIEVDPFNKTSYFSGNNLHFLLFHMNPSFTKALSYPYLAKYSLKDTSVNSYGQFPKQLIHLIDNGNFYSNYKIFPRFVINDSLSIVSFMFEHNIRLYNNKTGKLIKEFMSKSNFISKFHSISLDYPGAEKSAKYSSEEPAYDGIYYDKYRKLYYRIAKHIQNYKNNVGHLKLYEDSPWSAIILNSDFKVIGETLFSSELFDFRYFFIVKEGIIVKKIESKEGELNYSLLKFNYKV